MRRRPTRPSPSMAVALVALFVALGGTGYAALKLPKNSVGSKQIKKNAVRSPDVKNHSLKGADIDVETLGPVGRATTADRALHANDAGALQGKRARAFVPAGRIARTNGEIKMALSAPPVVLLRSGPFRVEMHCDPASAGTRMLTLTAFSSEPGSVIDRDNELTNAFVGPAGKPLFIRTTANAPFGSHSFSMAAPSGAKLDGVFNAGLNVLGADCVAGMAGTT